MNNETAVQNGIIYQIRQKYGIVADSDFYKASHHPQYIPGATRMISYIESRGGEYDKVCNFGLQLIIKEYFLQPLNLIQVNNMIEWAKEHMIGVVPEEFENALLTVVNEYDGKLPIRIRNAQEGLMIPVKNVLCTVESTVDDPRVFSLVSYFETKILRVWNTMTTATKSMGMRAQIKEKLELTSDIPEILLPIMLHDFGARGCTSMEQAAFGGAAHLVAFRGSDTNVGIMAAEIGYHDKISAMSIAASEHSSTTSNGRNGEINLVKAMFKNYAKPGAIFATVIDSYDALRFIREIAPQFKQALADSGAMKWVFRPDSGNPVTMPVKCVEELDKVFGHTVNGKGFKVLNGVGVIQGDGIAKEEVNQIMDLLISKGWCVSNVAFGMGGGLLQKHDRDTLKFSMKCCAIKVNGEWLEVYKNPAVYDEDFNLIETEFSFKKSKRGQVELMHNIRTGEYATKSNDSVIDFSNPVWQPALETVYENGVLVRDMTFEQVRRNAGTL